MAQLKTKRELATEAQTLATSFSYVKYADRIYIPTDYETGDDSVTPPPERTIWVPLGQEDVQIKALHQFDTMFDSEGQFRNFYYMVLQATPKHTDEVTSLLVRTEQGLKELRADGQLHDPSGSFVPNTLRPMLNTDRHDRRHVFETIANWVDGEEDAISLLHHLATALVPHQSAVKYLLFLGTGRNGKSLMMEMLKNIFGRDNCSNVTRQNIAENSPVVHELSGKLLNIVTDGEAVYLRDSGREKSLIAGETVGVRKLYASVLTPVQTNALFIEGLNQEPKSSDKTSALQARLVRFGFPNVYQDDPGFWDDMNSEKHLGALLNLMIEHYVPAHRMTEMLAPTRKSIALKLEHMVLNSKPLQFIKYVDETDPFGAESLIGMEFPDVVTMFNSWLLKEMNDINTWAEPDALTAFRPLLMTDRKSKRVAGKSRHVRRVVAFTKDAQMFIDSFKEEDADDSTTAVVED